MVRPTDAPAPEPPPGVRINFLCLDGNKLLFLCPRCAPMRAVLKLLPGADESIEHRACSLPSEHELDLEATAAENALKDLDFVRVLSEGRGAPVPAASSHFPSTSP